MSYSDQVVSTHNREFLIEKQEAMGVAAYLDWIWQTREQERRGMLPDDQNRMVSIGGWPGNTKELPPVVVRMQVQK